VYTLGVDVGEGLGVAEGTVHVPLVPLHEACTEYAPTVKQPPAQTARVDVGGPAQADVENTLTVTRPFEAQVAVTYAEEPERDRDAVQPDDVGIVPLVWVSRRVRQPGLFFINNRFTEKL
jgi:hypothetical protein